MQLPLEQLQATQAKLKKSLLSYFYRAAKNRWAGHAIGVAYYMLF
jgi:hypothetical protein